ncbi:MAG: hypothetical protein M1358_25575, partial [Chloroflexi bacterium]|nr:hypothetical protein [Chloroflexota bacterium]
MKMGNSIPPVAESSPGMSTKTKAIIGAQGILILLIVLVTVKALSGPDQNTGMPASNQSSIGTTSGSSPVGASPNAGSAVSTSPSAIPQKLGAVTLLNAVTGQDALNNLSELHGKGVGITGGWVGHYQARATVWVGEATDEKGAVQLLDAMVSRISAGNATFRDLRSAIVATQQVYSVTGLGQNHYFYQKGNKVIWLALPTNKPEDFLRDALQL